MNDVLVPGLIFMMWISGLLCIATMDDDTKG